MAFGSVVPVQGVNFRQNYEHITAQIFNDLVIEITQKLLINAMIYQFFVFNFLSDITAIGR